MLNITQGVKYLNDDSPWVNNYRKRHRFQRLTTVQTVDGYKRLHEASFMAFTIGLQPASRSNVSGPR